jgi:DNA-binding CsgD family transcriptional regulator
VKASRITCTAELSRIETPGDERLWRDAQEAWQALGDPLEAAYAGWRCAEALLVSDGDRASAAVLLREAFSVATDLGSKPLIDELRRLARRIRLGLGPQADRGEPVSGDLERFELTARELEVFALLGEGMTNREIAAELFISEKTASVHVSRILAKLSVPNRAAAAAAAQRLGVQRSQAATAG